MFGLYETVVLSNLPSVRMPGSILSPIAELMSIVYNMLFNFLNNMSVGGTLGFAIIIFTLIIKFLLFPLTLKQQKSAYKMRALQPEIDKIRDKYATKKDAVSQQKMALEIQDFQKSNDVNVFGGCLPLLIQLPILYALFYLFQNAYVYVDIIGNNYINIANAIIDIPAELRMDVFGSFAHDFVNTNIKADVFKSSDFDLSITNDVVMLVNYLKVDEWNTILESLGNQGNTLSALLEEKHHMETFMFIPLVSSSGLGFPGIFVPIIAGITTYIQTKITTASQPEMDPNNPMASVTQTMTIVMPFMMGFFCITMPAGLGLYWIIGNIFGIIQQIVLKNFFAKKFEEEATING